MQIETDLPDGEHLLPSGGVAVTKNRRLVEIRAPRNGDDRDANSQQAAHDEAEQLVRVPIDAALLRVDPVCYVDTTPHSRPPHEFRRFDYLSKIEQELLTAAPAFKGYDYAAHEWRWVRTGDGITWVCRPVSEAI